MVKIPEGNLPNPSVSGELPASRLPRLPWLKIPRQNLTLQTILKYHTNHDFLHFSPKGTVPKLFGALHEKHNTGDREYILLKNENGFTRYKV